MYKTVSLSILAMLVFAGWIETAAIAQIETATLVGSVKDSSGAVVAGAKVTIVNSETSFRSETTTSRGELLPSLPEAGRLPGHARSTRLQTLRP